MTSATTPLVGPGSKLEKVTALLASSVGSVFPSASLWVSDGGVCIMNAQVGGCDASTLFDLASLTKPLCTALLCMRLVDQDRIALTDEVRPGITVRQLLSHSSGLPAWRSLGADRATIIDAVFREPLLTAPGSAAVYSDLGFILLGEAIEEVTGDSLDVAFTREIAAPLGIAEDLRFLPAAARCAPTENGRQGLVDDDNARTMGGVAGHAGLFGTAPAVAKIVTDLVRSWSGAPGLASTETVRTFWSPSGVPGSTWCLGWDRPAPVGSLPGSSAGERWPRDGVGHLGFTGCSIWIDPARARWVVLLSNRVCPTRANEAIKQLRPRLHDSIVAALDDPRDP